MLSAVEKRIKEKKTAEEIGGELCETVKNPTRKVKYLIRKIAEEKQIPYKKYVEKYPTLNLQPQKARKTQTIKLSDKILSESDKKEPNTYLTKDAITELNKVLEYFTIEYPRKNYKPHTQSSIILELIKQYQELKGLPSGLVIMHSK